VKTATLSASQHAAAALVHAALEARHLEIRGEHCCGGAPRQRDTWPDPAEYDLRLPTLAEILTELPGVLPGGDNDIENAMLAADQYTSRLMHEHAESLPESDQPPATGLDDVSWCVCTVDGKRATVQDLLIWLNVEND
jgi:hypothetical protein